MGILNRKSKKTASMDPKENETDKLLGNKNDESSDTDVILSGDAGDDEYGDHQILIEICSAEDLSDVKIGKPDPYVTVFLGDTIIHKTKNRRNTYDPIWTAKSGSLFLLSVDSEAFSQTENGVTFTVIDKDVVSDDDVLGSVSVPKDTVLGSKGERKEFELLKEGAGNSSVGTLVLRFRNATAHDKRFMKALANDDVTPDDMLPDFMLGNSNLKGNYLKPNVPIEKRSLLSRLLNRHEDPNMTYVRPVPDPGNPDQQYMAKENIDVVSMDPSRNWIEVGGRKSLGKVFIEIIKCDNLPQQMSDKSDPFVSIACEDNFVNTDVIFGCKSPRWLPWTNRAFTLNVYNPLSPIKIGVLDYDEIGSDDGLGRISISPGNFRPGTEYILNYDLLNAAGGIVTDQKSNSTLTIRLHTEIDASKMIWATLKFPTPPERKQYISVDNKKDYDNLSYTIADHSAFTIGNLRYCVADLLSYSDSLLYINEAVTTVLFWRGTYFITDGFALPIHSAVVFVSSAFIVEHPRYIPSFLFGLAAWILVGTMNFKQNNPDPWARTLSYPRMFFTAICGCFFKAPQSINPFDEGELMKIKDHQQYWINAKKAAEIKAKEATVYADVRKEVEDEADKITSVNMETQSHGLFAFLDPVQGTLYNLCVTLRLMSNIITWEEHFVTFWLTTLLILLSVLSSFVPWGTVIFWSIRVMVWTLFGPWMGLLGCCFAKKDQDAPETAKEKRAKKQNPWKRITLRNARTIREKLSSFRAMEILMFGKYTKMAPSVQTERLQCIPLGSSSATRSDFNVRGVRPKYRIMGQAFEVDMIPSSEHTVDKKDYDAEKLRFEEDNRKSSTFFDAKGSVYYESIN